MNLQTRLGYCSATTSDTAYRSKIRSYVLCGINITALFLAGLVFLANKAALKRKYSNLQSSYQLQENIDVIYVIIPLSIVQSFCHLLLSAAGAILFAYEGIVSAITYRILLTATYIIPYYTLIAPVLLLLLLKWSSKKRTTKLIAVTNLPDENSTYFATYSKMWDVTVDKYKF
ncbi:unnamed protein product [Cylicostephanus goldi]|uniref:Uncharacterized protein n=1 Tax=Cylicostephanus goldi TaxID=71465 RepID=A0A3P6RQZ2_CYLGO|nr:unnamed protein product [Cylicostephanus goldi]